MARPAVTVLSGYSRVATWAVARELLAAPSSPLLVRHDLTAVRAGVVRREVRDAGGVIEDERVQLVHGCVSCTLREDVLPCLARLAATWPGRDIVLVLPEVVEPEAVAAACATCTVDGRLITELVWPRAFVTVVDAGTVLDDLASTDDLADRGQHAADDDARSVACVVARQVEFADVVVRWGGPVGDAYADERLRVILHRLAPWAQHVRATERGTGLAERLRAIEGPGADRPAVLLRAIEGAAVGVDEPDPDCGVVSVLFEARRPFHPHRLHAVLEEVTGGLLRSRGHLWLASQPELLLGWESAGGGLGIGVLDTWLDVPPDAEPPVDEWPAEVDQRRRETALATWDPYYADRSTSLALIGIGVDAEALRAQLTACLLTDAELADGEEGWRALPDPFAGVFDQADSDVPTMTSERTMP